jgi:hypothetical protein
MKRIFTLVLVLGLALPTVAAGANALTHAQLLTRADAVCKRYAPQLQSPPGVEGEVGDPAYDAAWLRLFDRQRRELVALVPPQRDAQRYQRFLAALPHVRAAFHKLTRAIEMGRPVKHWAPLVRRLEAAEDEAGVRARAVGLRRCFRAGETAAQR